MFPSHITNFNEPLDDDEDDAKWSTLNEFDRLRWKTKREENELSQLLETWNFIKRNKFECLHWGAWFHEPA